MAIRLVWTEYSGPSGAAPPLGVTVQETDDGVHWVDARRGKAPAGEARREELARNPRSWARVKIALPGAAEAWLWFADDGDPGGGAA